MKAKIKEGVLGFFSSKNPGYKPDRFTWLNKTKSVNEHQKAGILELYDTLKIILKFLTSFLNKR